MARANAAYYAGRDPFADFTTAPEISQVFGEILGLWAAVVWHSMGSPDPVILAEAGPGRGTLMADALRAAARVPGFAAALRLHLVETSPRLRAIQAEKLPGAVWHDRIEDIPAGPMILLANEFLDAMPIRQFVRTGDGWAERFVVEGAFTEFPAVPPALPDAEEGEICEWNEAGEQIAATLAARIASQGGIALFLDYGPSESASGESLQALRDGKPADPLDAPGSADLTAHVDFAGIARAARAAGAETHGPKRQGSFLTALGLFQRSFALARSQEPRRAAAIVDAAQRLAQPERMGRLFKVLALCQPGLPMPPGFEKQPDLRHEHG